MSSAAAPVRCLVVDDHEALRAGIVAALGAEPDMEVVGDAAEAESALALVERRRPDIAIVDVHLEGVDGIELCRRLGEAGSGVAVLLYTADRNPGLVHAGLQAGAAGFLLKSGPLRELIRAIRAVTGGGTYVDSTIVTALLEHREEAAPSTLSVRETQVLQLLADGETTDAAAKALFLSPATVRSYLESAMLKLGTRNRAQAIGSAVRRGLIT